MKLLMLNGPNINFLGIREPEIYGATTYSQLEEQIRQWGKELGLETECYQSNHEGDLVDKIQEAYDWADGIVFNPGAYTHTSIAILDALKAVGLPAVEVHISDVSQREDFRQISYIRSYCQWHFIGLGIEGYRKGMEALKAHLSNSPLV